MRNQQTTFWDAVKAAHHSIAAGDMPAAMQAIQVARKESILAPEGQWARRHELLDSLTRMAEPNRPLTATTQRILVSGIGRSGTTLIYQQLANMLLLDERKVNFRYEPYLWNIRGPKTKGNPFDMSQLHHFGLLTHCSVPLFLKGSDSVHDPFLDHLFNESWDRDSSQRPDSYLTKVIRGSGRLRSYLNRFPDLKIVACLRNPIDTINSSLGMFSFFGEEFHTDDRPRLRSELEARGSDISQLNAPYLSTQWYGSWWRAFTEETLAVAVDYPENVMLFCYESFQNAPIATLESLMSFVGTRNLGMFMGLSKPAGPSIKATSLTQHDVRVLGPHIKYYTETVLRPALGDKAATARTDSIISRYLDGRFSFPIAGSNLGRRCPIQLRDMMLCDAKNPFKSLMQRHPHPISLEDLIQRHLPTDSGGLRKPALDGDALKKGKRFGVVITCYNNETTIVDAVLSCLNQTLPFDEIVVVNDSSTDNSSAFLAELETRYSCLSILNLPSNLGPSASRDLGIRKLTTDFFTQLDGDDLFWPTKNAREAAAIGGDENAVAFSDILLVRPETSFVQRTEAYASEASVDVWKTLLARTPQIPRDLTASRKSYFKTRGYDITRNLYEDWDFKLRLARATKTWIHADGLAGTVYNRLSPGLSGVGDSQHARSLSEIFLSALDTNTDVSNEAVLSSFDAALGRFNNCEVTVRARTALEACINHDCSLSRIADLASRRDMRAADTKKFTEKLDAFAQACPKAPITT